MLKQIFPISSVLVLSACSSLNGFFGDSLMGNAHSGSYYDSAYNDHNKPPASMVPPSSKNGEEDRLDPHYIRTQADYYFQVGEAYSLEGDHKKAVEAFKMVLVYDPKSSVVNVRLAGEYVKLGQMSLALEYAESAVEKDHQSVDARILLGGIYSALKTYDKAFAQYQEILKIDKDNLEAPLYIGALYAEKKDYDLALKYFIDLAKNDNNSSPYVAWYYVGRIRSEHAKKAIQTLTPEAYKKALSYKPDYVEAIVGLGNYYAKVKQEEKTIELYRNFQREHGPHPRLAEYLVQYYLEKEQLELAYEQLEALEGNTDDTLNNRMRMALILIEQKDYPKAIAKLNEVLAQAPESDKIRFYLAAVYEETQQHSKAVENFLKIPPESQYYSESVVHAAYLLKQSKNSSEAMKVVKEGLKSRQDIPQFYTIYASLLDDNNEHQEASKILESASSKFPDNLQVQFFLGTVQDRLGNKARVIQQMRKVVEIDPNHVQGLNYLAFTLAESSKDLDEAEGLVRRAMTLEPNDGYILDTLGWILYKQGKVTDAIKYLEAAFKSQPNESIIAEHLGDAYRRNHLLEKAKNMYRRAAEFEIDSEKVRDIREKITAIENQEFKNQRSPASVELKN